MPGADAVTRTSPWNRLAGAEAAPTEPLWPDPLVVVDSTLRKALFTAGAITSPAGFLRIAEALAAAGVREESLNIDWAGADAPVEAQWRLFRDVARAGCGLRLNVYTDTLLTDGRRRPAVTMRETAELLVEHGADALAPGLLAPPDASARARQRDELSELFDVANALGVGVTLTIAQVGLRDLAEMVDAVDHAVAMGLTRVDLMDSTSTMHPAAMRLFVHRFRERLRAPVPITMHAHDDFGLATANALAAAAAGASPDVAVAGVSYRAGFAALEEVVLALEVLHERRTGIDLSRLQSLADLVARETGLPVHPLKPVVGRYAFLRHMPFDVGSTLRGRTNGLPAVTSCVAPEVVGARITWVWDRLSTDDMCLALSESLGVEISADEARVVRAELDRAVDRITGYPRWLTAEQAAETFLAVVRGLRSSPSTSTPDLDAFNRLDHRTALESAYACCSWAPLAEAIVRGRPYDDAEHLAAAADAAIRALSDDSLLRLVDKHPEIGATRHGGGRSGAYSAREQDRLAREPAHLDELRRLTAEYRRRFGVTYLVAAFDRTGAELVADLTARLDHDRVTELAVIRDEFARIVGRRLRRTVASSDPAASVASGVG